MSRINSRKYNHLAQTFQDLLKAADQTFGPTYWAENYGSAISLVQTAHDRIQIQKCRELAKCITDLGDQAFDKHRSFESPSYYGYGHRDSDSIRGLTLGEAYERAESIDSYFYWEALGGCEFWMDLDRKRFVQTITDQIEYENAPADLVLLEDPINRDIDNCQWGDETIMSKSEWNRLVEFMDQNDIYPEEHSDLIWHDASGFDRATIINLIQELDDDYHSDWGGTEEYDDCILNRLEELNAEQPLLALNVADKIESAIANTKLSWSQRYRLCEQALDQAEALVD